jgi:hypothetical protein
MTAPRPSLSPSEREQLRQFVRVVDSMSRRRFMERFRQQDHTLRFIGEVAGPEYDREDFEAFLTDFRKVAMSTSEPIYLTKVLKTVGKYATDELREQLKGFYEDLVPRLEGRKALMTYNYPRGDKTISLTLEQVLSTLVNGEIFHVSPEHAEQASELRTRNELYYLWPTLHFSVMPVVRASIWLYHAIRHDGILGEFDYPTPYPLNGPEATDAGPVAPASPEG